VSLPLQMLAMSLASLLISFAGLRSARLYGTQMQYGVSLGFIGVSAIALLASAATFASGVPL